MQAKTRPIFDIIEESSSSPTVFDWSSDLESAKYSPEEFIFEGELATFKEVASAPSKRHYVLTLNGIIKHKKRDSLERKEWLRLGNPRLYRIDEPRFGLRGFRLSGYMGQHEFYAESAEAQEDWIDKLKKVCICSNISAYYNFGKLVGKGNFAKVHIAREKYGDRTFAVKTIEKAKLVDNQKNLLSLENEILVLRRINHPNVIQLYEVYENDLYVHLILEYLKGGELLQLIQKKGIYSEKDAALAIKCVLSALAYCHERNIIHRDLKPENLILVDTDSDSTLKIADFGLATVAVPGVPEKLRCGSPGYVAPEILNNLGYGTKADVFSAGVILYILLCGISPFHGKSYHEVLAKNRTGVVLFEDKCWSAVSPEGKDLVSRMVNKDPNKRISAREALEHRWFTTANTKKGTLSSALENMKKYHNKDNEDRFNVEKIKPEFAMTTRTPLLVSRFALQDSPLILSKSGSRDQSPTLSSSAKEENKERQYGLMFNNILNKFKPSQLGPSKLSKDPAGRFPGAKNSDEEDDAAADYKADEIDERNGTDREINVTYKEMICKPFVPQDLDGRKLPLTPGFSSRKVLSYLKVFGTPLLTSNISRPRQQTGYISKLLCQVKTANKDDTGKPNRIPLSNELPKTGVMGLTKLRGLASPATRLLETKRKDLNIIHEARETGEAEEVKVNKGGGLTPSSAGPNTKQMPNRSPLKLAPDPKVMRKEPDFVRNELLGHLQRDMLQARTKWMF